MHVYESWVWAIAMSLTAKWRKTSTTVINSIQIDGWTTVGGVDCTATQARKVHLRTKESALVHASIPLLHLACKSTQHRQCKFRLYLSCWSYKRLCVWLLDQVSHELRQPIDSSNV